MEQPKERSVSLIPVRGEGERLHTVITPISGTHAIRTLYRAAAAFLYAMLCLLCVAVVLLTALITAERIRTPGTALRLAEKAFLGSAYFEIEEMITDSGENLPWSQDRAAEAPDVLDPLEKLPLSKGGTTEDTDGKAGDVPSYPIVQADLSATDPLHTLTNETAYDPDTKALLTAHLPFENFAAWQEEYGTDAPYILILHTHGTEAYTPEGADSYTAADSFRSSDTAENVVAVGTAMAEVFDAAGIPALHCTVMFDEESYTSAYSRAAAAIRAYLEEYPSIRIILDVHRDSIVRADMTRVQPVTEIGRAEYAQCMLVVGTDAHGGDFPGWRNNLNFALKVQSALTAYSDSIARAVNLRGATFNEQYCSGSLLVEIGSCGNTLSQAKRTGALLALSIANTVTDGTCTLSPSDIAG